MFPPEWLESHILPQLNYPNNCQTTLKPRNLELICRAQEVVCSQKSRSGAKFFEAERRNPAEDLNRNKWGNPRVATKRTHKDEWISSAYWQLQSKQQAQVQVVYEADMREWN